MRKDLREGFDYCEMAPFVGWGKIKTHRFVRERYISIRLGRRILFLCFCHSYPDPDYQQEHRYMRWWFRAPLKV